LAGSCRLEQADRIAKTGFDNFEACCGIVEVDVQFRRDPADKFLNLPNGFAVSALFAEDNDFVHVGLWIITQNQAEQCRFSGAVWSKQGPAFTGADGPVDVAQNCRSAVA